jgi:serine/threonine protein kinase
MALLSGKHLGCYEIVSQIGAGGMGEVYRARDVNLNRDVAVKVLLNLSTDPQRLRRFEQEARAAGSINHPNILAIYHMGTYEGAPYLVSELLEGETLRQVIKRGPLPTRKVIDYGVQIANGLQAAHEKGIVHRDLKPENVFLTRDGRIKILDFGLAKLTQPETPEPGTQTITSVTEPGVVMGTVGYMSPEQVRGEHVDQRTDIFAFGAMLYEMLAGRPAFQYPTATESMTAILREDPPNILDIVPYLPIGIQRVVQRCIEKGPDQRFHSAADLAFALSSAADSPMSGPRQAIVVAKKPSGKNWLIAAGAGTVALVLATGLLWPKMHRRAEALTDKPVTSGKLETEVHATSDAVVTAKPVVPDKPAVGVSSALENAASAKTENSAAAGTVPSLAPSIESKVNENRVATPRELTIPDAAIYTWFDPKTRQAMVWYAPSSGGNFRFFDGPGVDPQTGQSLSPVTPQMVAELVRRQSPSPAMVQKQKPQNTSPRKAKVAAANDAASEQLREDARLETMAQEGQVALNNEDYREALDICGKVLSAAAGSQPCAAIQQHAAIKLAEQLVNEGAAYWEKGDFAKALHSAEKALELDPANKNAAKLKKLALRMKPQG